MGESVQKETPEEVSAFGSNRYCWGKAKYEGSDQQKTLRQTFRTPPSAEIEGLV